VAAATVAGAVGGAVGMQLGLARVEVRVAGLEANHTDMHRQIAELDQRGSRTLPVVESRLTSLEMRVGINVPAIEKMGLQITSFEQRLKLMEDTIVGRTKVIEDLVVQSRTLTPLQQAITDSIRGDIRRLDERQDRLTQALDATYNLLNEHLRTPNQKK
jgi:uncharacterized coiled-coil protein SlyX